jgi:small ligand-binding sensory domain FIST
MRVEEQLGGRKPDLVLVFASPHHVSSMARVSSVLGRRLSPGCMVGVTGEAVIGGYMELEGLAGLSVLAAVLPGVGVKGFAADDIHRIIARGGRDDEQDLAELSETTGVVRGHAGTTLLPPLIKARRVAWPEGSETGGMGPGSGQSGRRAPIIGGIASAAQRPRGNALMLNDRVMNSGLVGVSLTGRVRIDAVVSQGCRAFGPNMVVTSASEGVIRTLGGRPALDVLQELIEAMPDQTRQLLSHGLMIGRVVDEYKDRFGPGDYLMRAVVGVSQGQKAVGIAETIPTGATVRFHLRDATTADADLALCMDAQALHGPPAGMMLITCNGRGTRLFNSANHDATVVQKAFADSEPGQERAKGGRAMHAPAGALPLAGFFAAGEIGPVGDGVFVHGQTACVAAFRPLP